MLEVFNQKYINFLKNPNNTKDQDIYDIGIDIVLETADISIKESVLNKLLFLFPDKCELYYFMGFIFLYTDVYKSLTWFKLCLKVNPHFQENILDYTKILYDLDYFKYIEYSNNLYDNFLYKSKDSRVLFFTCCMLIHFKMFKTAESNLIKLIDLLETNNSSSVEKMLFAYANLAYIYMTNGKFEKFFYYHTKLMEMYDPNNKKANYIYITRIAFQNYVSVCNYIYDDSDRYKICRAINDTFVEERPFHFGNRRRPNKIRIGYVSSDGLDGHAVTNFISPIIANHDRDKFEIYLLTEKACQYNNCTIFEIYNKPLTDCTSYIYNNNIDILIDIDGYTSSNHLEIFSKHPAPIQVTYLGYPNTLGLDFIEYRITDNYADDSKSLQIFSEKLLRMPRCFLLFKSIIQENPVKYRGVDPTCIVLGSLNRENKSTDHVLSVWKRVLEALPNTKLLIKLDGIDSLEERKERYITHLGVTEERLIIIEKCDNDEYCELFSKIDILLDTFPYSGTTTSCNALFNSIPVVTMYHKNYHAHNVTSSMLMNCGLQELITYTPDEYVNKVIELCNTPEKINDYKKTIGKLFNELMNPVEFMKDYEQIFINLVNNYYYNSI
jgi:predicted O-linked N-acetylglucosamine transferase (SPINDLY family)